MRKTRRGPWLSGLLVALLGAVWMGAQVLGGIIGMVTGFMHTNDELTATAVVWPEQAGDGTR